MVFHKVIDPIELRRLDGPDQVGGVGEIPVMQHQVRVAFVWVLAKVIELNGGD